MIYLLVFEVFFLTVFTIIGICTYKHDKAQWRELERQSRLNPYQGPLDD